MKQTETTTNTNEFWDEIHREWFEAAGFAKVEILHGMFELARDASGAVIVSVRSLALTFKLHFIEFDEEAAALEFSAPDMGREHEGYLCVLVAKLQPWLTRLRGPRPWPKAWRESTAAHPEQTQANHAMRMLEDFEGAERDYKTGIVPLLLKKAEYLRFPQGPEEPIEDDDDRAMRSREAFLALSAEERQAHLAAGAARTAAIALRLREDEDEDQNEPAVDALVPYEFDGDRHEVAQNSEGAWFSIRGTCEAVALDRRGQQRSCESRTWVRGRMMLSDDVGATGDTVSPVGSVNENQPNGPVSADGKRRAMYCIHISQVAMWLATINAKNVKPELRPKLLRYQMGLADDLAKRYAARPAVAPAIPRTRPPVQLVRPTPTTPPPVSWQLIINWEDEEMSWVLAYKNDALGGRSSKTHEALTEEKCEEVLKPFIPDWNLDMLGPTGTNDPVRYKAIQAERVIEGLWLTVAAMDGLPYGAHLLECEDNGATADDLMNWGQILGEARYKYHQITGHELPVQNEPPTPKRVRKIAKIAAMYNVKMLPWQPPLPPDLKLLEDRRLATVAKQLQRKNERREQKKQEKAAKKLPYRNPWRCPCKLSPNTHAVGAPPCIYCKTSYETRLCSWCPNPHATCPCDYAKKERTRLGEPEPEVYAERWGGHDARWRCKCEDILHNMHSVVDARSCSKCGLTYETRLCAFCRPNPRATCPCATARRSRAYRGEPEPEVYAERYERRPGDSSIGDVDQLARAELRSQLAKAGGTARS